MRLLSPPLYNLSMTFYNLVVSMKKDALWATLSSPARRLHSGCPTTRAVDILTLQRPAWFRNLVTVQARPKRFPQLSQA